MNTAGFITHTGLVRALSTFSKVILKASLAQPARWIGTRAEGALSFYKGAAAPD